MRRRAPSSSAVAFFALLTIAGCTLEVRTVDAGRIDCTLDRDCRPGWRCVDRVCVDWGAGDPTPGDGSPAGDARCPADCCADCAGRCAGAEDGCGGHCSENQCAGCCDGAAACIPPAAESSTQCGGGGTACVDCTATAAVCWDHACCLPSCAGKCAGASDGCGGLCAATTCTGCCDGQAVCIAPGAQTDGQCGSGGAACEICTATSRVCYDSACCAPACAGRCDGAADDCGGTCASNTCDGCCDGQHVCVAPGSQTDQLCGSGGALCVDCTGTGDACYQTDCCDPLYPVRQLLWSESFDTNPWGRWQKNADDAACDSESLDVLWIDNASSGCPSDDASSGYVYREYSGGRCLSYVGGGLDTAAYESVRLSFRYRLQNDDAHVVVELHEVGGNWRQVSSPTTFDDAWHLETVDVPFRLNGIRVRLRSAVTPDRFRGVDCIRITGIPPC